jgi:hypothetical protein
VRLDSISFRFIQAASRWRPVDSDDDRARLSIGAVATLSMGYITVRITRSFLLSLVPLTYAGARIAGDFK